MRNAVSFLIETRGVGIGRAHYKRRVYTHLVAMNTFVDTAATNAEMLLAHAGQKHANVEILGAEPLQKDVVILLRPHQVDVLIACDPLFLAAGRDRPDLDRHGPGLLRLESKLLDARLPKKTVVGFQTVIAGGNIESRLSFE